MNKIYQYNEMKEDRIYSINTERKMFVPVSIVYQGFQFSKDYKTPNNMANIDFFSQLTLCPSGYLPYLVKCNLYEQSLFMCL